MNKVCKKCEELKEYTDFTKDATKKDGMGYYCKKCYNNIRKKLRKSKPYRDKEKEYQKKYRDKLKLTNPDYQKTKSKVYYNKKVRLDPEYHKKQYAKFKSSADWAQLSYASMNGSKVDNEGINAEFLRELLITQDNKCYYTGVFLEKIDRNSPYIISVDRKDSSKRYTKDNVVLCCRSINYAKNNMDIDVFTSFLEDISKNFLKKKLEKSTDYSLCMYPTPRSQKGNRFLFWG